MKSFYLCLFFRLQDLREESENLELQEKEKQFQAQKEHKEAMDEINQMNAELKAKLRNILGAAMRVWVCTSYMEPLARRFNLNVFTVMKKKFWAF